MISDRLYARVSDICEEITPYTGDYMRTRVEAVNSGAMKPAQFKLDMRIASGKFNEAHAELNAVRFPRWKQRFALAMFTAGIRRFEQAIAYAIEAVDSASSEALWRKFEERTEAATRASREYTAFVWRDRSAKGRRG